MLGSVVLTITGAEALYADMGHFGRKSIARAWYFVAFPGLLLNYFGQGAHVIAHPESSVNPFFALAPEGWSRLALTLLSIVAAVVASQAVISGAYSLTRSAIQLGYFPRLKITHTNAELAGQIYVPLVNMSLAVLAIAIVASFGSSDRLAAAYGIAVTGTMVVTNYAFYRVTRLHWHWPLWRSLTFCGLFMAVDATFFVATLHKILDGGWLPIAISGIVVAIMHTWKSGKNEIHEKVYSRELAELELSQVAGSKSILRVPGSAVFMAGSARGVPLALLHHLKSKQGAAANRGADDDRQRRGSTGARRRTSGRRGPRAWRLARDRALRLHGIARHHRAFAARERPGRPAQRAGGDLLFQS